MKRFIGMLVIMIVLIVTALSSSAYVFDGSGYFYSTDHTGAYRIYYRGSSVTVNKYSSVNRNAELILQYNVSSVCCFGGKAVFLCSDTVNNQLIVYVYNIDNDVLDSFGIYGAKAFNNIDFCCDDNYFYIENQNSPKELRKYSYSGKLIKSYSFNSDITYAVCGYSSGVYICCGGSLYFIDGDTPSTLSGDEIDTPVLAASDKIMVSAYGDVYSVSGGAKRLFKIGSDSKIQSACVVGNTLYCSYGSVINGYDLNSGDKVSYYNHNSAPRALYAYGGSLTAVDGDGKSSLINRGLFISTITESEDNKSDSVSVDNTSGAASSYSSNSTITSGIYKISYDDHKISGISPGTTVAGFKSNINYPGYTATVYNSGSEKKSGSVGTAMTVVFSSDSTSYTFELSVRGDLTGEGNSNSRDLKVLMDYLIGSADFNGVYSLSADFNGDGKIDVVDLAILKREIS